MVGKMRYNNRIGVSCTGGNPALCGIFFCLPPCWGRTSLSNTGRWSTWLWESRLTRVHNYGAAWSSFSGQTAALAVVTVLLMAAVAYLLVRRIVRHPLGVIAGLMILAGGVGNLIDRLFRGYVVDMFDLTLFSYPVFNFADCCVVVGAILGAVYYLFLYDKYDKKDKKHGNDPADGDN